MTNIKRDRERIVEIVRDAGGKVVGRTRLQKIAYLLELTGQGEGFSFEYRHYGPYSEALSEAAQAACLFDLMIEEEYVAQWGGRYSIYSLEGQDNAQKNETRAQFIEAAASFSAIELELAATAAYINVVEGRNDPWEETRRRKPEKAADGRLDNARRAYEALRKLDVPKALPDIVH